jgi:hypothetical protein
LHPCNLYEPNARLQALIEKRDAEEEQRRQAEEEKREKERAENDKRFKLLEERLEVENSLNLAHSLYSPRSMLTKLYSYRLLCNLKAVEMMPLLLQQLNPMEMMPPSSSTRCLKM